MQDCHARDNPIASRLWQSLGWIVAVSATKRTLAQHKDFAEILGVAVSHSPGANGSGLFGIVGILLRQAGDWAKMWQN